MESRYKYMGGHIKTYTVEKAQLSIKYTKVMLVLFLDVHPCMCMYPLDLEVVGVWGPCSKFKAPILLLPPFL